MHTQEGEGGFVANELQLTLFIAVGNTTKPGRGHELAADPEVVNSWLRFARETIVAIGRMGQAAASQTSKEEMVLMLLGQSGQLPLEAWDWLRRLECLRALVDPTVLAKLDADTVRERLQKLGTLHENFINL